MNRDTQTKGDEMMMKIIGLAIALGIGSVVAINIIGTFSRIATTLSVAASF